MGARILDELSGLDVSRQRLWQLRKARDHRCVGCGSKHIVTRHRCEPCRVKINAHIRKYAAERKAQA